MKGLIIKDICLLKSQKNTMPVFLLLMLWFVLMDNISFVFIYMGMMAALLACGTLSYDEFDRGYSFLFTLPFERREYVRSKFLLGFALFAAGALAACLLVWAAGLIKGNPMPAEDAALSIFSAFLTCALILSVMIPMRIRFGSEQGRIVVFAVFAGLAALVFAAVKLLPPSFTEGLYSFSQANGLLVIIFGLVVPIAVIILIGYALSIKIINKKEF